MYTKKWGNETYAVMMVTAWKYVLENLSSTFKTIFLLLLITCLNVSSRVSNKCILLISFSNTPSIVMDKNCWAPYARREMEFLQHFRVRSEVYFWSKSPIIPIYCFELQKFGLDFQETESKTIPRFNHACVHRFSMSASTLLLRWK